MWVSRAWGLSVVGLVARLNPEYQAAYGLPSKPRASVARPILAKDRHRSLEWRRKRKNAPIAEERHSAGIANTLGHNRSRL
jgi:hypothetical protein